MKCNSCGNEIQPEQAFCPNCGARISNEQAVNYYESKPQQSVFSLKKKLMLLAGIFIDYFICCRLIGGWFGLILLVLTFIASPHLCEPLFKIPAKTIKEFMIHLGVFFIVILFLLHGISKDRQYSKWEIEDYGKDTRSISERIHDVLTREPEFHSRYTSYEQEQTNNFIDIYGFDPVDEVDITTFSQEAIVPSFKDLRNNIANYRGTAIKVKGLIIGKYAPEDYMEGITEIGIDANEFNEILDTYYGYTCLNDNSEVAGSYVVITADPSAYPNEWKEIYGYPVGVNKAGDIIIWGEFFLDEGKQVESVGQNVMETIPADTVAETRLDNSDYILPDSNLRYISKDELNFLDKGTLRVARNEIYARHGRQFSSADLNEYFNAQPWYEGYISAEAFDDSVLNEYEKANLVLIKSVEDGASEYAPPDYIAGSSEQLGEADIINCLYTANNGTTMEIGEYSGTGETYVNFFQNDNMVWRGVVNRYHMLNDGGLALMFEGDNYATGKKDHLQVEWGTKKMKDSPVVVHESDTISISGTYSFSYPLFGN